MPHIREIRRVTATRLELDERPEVMDVLVGLLLLAVGLALLATCARMLVTEPSPAGMIVGLSWALPFTVGGAWTSLGRAWIVVDSSGRSVTRTVGLVVPWRTRTYSFTEFSEVRLRRMDRDPDPPVRHQILLSRHAGARPLRICTLMWWPEIYEEPGHLAADIGRRVGVPVCDSAAVRLLERIGKTKYFGSPSYRTYQPRVLQDLFLLVFREEPRILDHVKLLTEGQLVRKEHAPHARVRPEELLDRWRLVLLPPGAAILEKAGIEFHPALVERTPRAPPP